METYPSLLIELPVDVGPPQYRILSHDQDDLGRGEVRIVSKIGRRSWKFDHKALSNNDVSTLETFWTTVKASTFLFTNPEDSNESVTVRFVNRGVIEMAGLTTIWDVKGVELQEVFAW